MSIRGSDSVEDAGLSLREGVVVVEPGSSPSVPAGKPDPKHLPKGYNSANRVHVQRARGQEFNGIRAGCTINQLTRRSKSH